MLTERERIYRNLLNWIESERRVIEQEKRFKDVREKRALLRRLSIEIRRLLDEGRARTNTECGRGE